MDTIFYKLLDNTLDEINRREPTYHARFPVTLASPAELATTYFRHPLCFGFSQELKEQALTEGIAYFAKSWTKEQSKDADDPVGRLLCESIVDALCADQGVLPLQPHGHANGSIAEALARQYSERQSPGGQRYFVRNRGSSPLLLVNATGLPIDTWRNLLGDETHDFKIIVPRRQGRDLFRGGLQEQVDIRTEATDLLSVIDAESMDKVDVLGWCNGARVAIDLTGWQPERISSLVLIGPMLQGIKGVTPNPSAFERDLHPLLEAVAKQSSLAPFLSKTIAQQAKPPDWNRFANDSGGRAQLLFGLPAKDHANIILAPMTEPASFVNVARRVASDEDYPMHKVLAELKTRTMVIMGSHDQIVSNAFAEAAMKQMCRNSVVKVVLTGSGHYIQDLQYHYLRLLLTVFLKHAQTPPQTARLSVEELS